MHSDKSCKQKNVCFAKDTNPETGPYRQGAINEIDSTSSNETEDADKVQYTDTIDYDPYTTDDSDF